MNRITQDQVEKMAERYIGGETVSAIAASTNTPVRTVHERLKRFGVHFRSRGVQKGYVFSKERNEKIKRKVKGVKRSQETRDRISEAKKSHYDGLNGYGHTKMQSKGYVLAYCPNHPNAHKDGYVMLHTLIMERKIGRYLTQDEVVHHINHVKSDNRITNLELMNKSEHSSMHMKERHSQRRKNTCSTFS